MTIKWEYDIEGTVEEIKELLGMMQPKAVECPKCKGTGTKTIEEKEKTA